MKTRHIALLALLVFLVGGVALWKVSVAPGRARRPKPAHGPTVSEPSEDTILEVDDDTLVVAAAGIQASIGPRRTALRDASAEIAWGAAEIAGLESEAARLHREGETAIVDRGSSVETFETRSDGIEHSIMVRRAPAGALRVRIPVSVEVTSGIDRVFLGDRFEYRGIRAWDAEGKNLIAKLGADERAVVLHVEAAEASYPVTIDPLLVPSVANWTASGDPIANAHFGLSVASAGDFNGDGYPDVVVGAPRLKNAGELRMYPTCNGVGPGKVFVYFGSANGLSTTPGWQTVGDFLSIDKFGSSVACAGDVDKDGYSDLLVGAPGQNSEQGKVFIFRGGNPPSQVAAWTLIGSGLNSRFGFSVASAGDVNKDGYSDIIIGQPFLADASALQGKAWIYYGSPNGPAAQPSVLAQGPFYGMFGVSVASAGDFNKDGYGDVIIGAWYDVSTQGRAYLYFGSSGGIVTGSYWTLKGAEEWDSRFGVSVACAGDVNHDGYSDVVVGAQGLTEANNPPIPGKAYVYYGNSTLPGFQSTLPSVVTSSSTGYPRFGYSVASAGDLNGDGFSDIVVGEPNLQGVGKAYAYLGSAAGLATTPAWTATGEGSTPDLFGYSVASFGGSRIVVGCPGFSMSGTANVGKVCAFVGPAVSTPPPPADTTAPDTTIAQAPLSLTNATTATLAFSANEAGCTFERSLDGGTWISAISPETISDLADGSHTYKVRAKDAAGNVDPTPASYTWSVDATPPIAPTIILYTPNPSTNGTVNVHWGEGGYDGNGSGVSKYDVLRVTDGTIVIVAENQGAAYLIVSGLANGSHVFQVRCTDAAGNVGPWSTNTNAVVVAIPSTPPAPPSTPPSSPPTTPPATDTTPPVAPTGLSAAPNPNNSGSHTISWNGVSDAAKYEIWVSTNNQTTWVLAGDAQTTNWKHALPVGSGNYAYKVRAVDAAGNVGPFSSVCHVVVHPVLSVASLNVTPNPTGGTHSIQWTVQGAVKQSVTRSANGGAFQEVINDLAGGATSVTIGDSIAEGSYVYKIVATDYEGNQQIATSASLIVDKTTPNPPAVVNWSLNANGTVTLTWGAGSDAGAYQSGLKYYVLRRKPVGGDWVVLSWKVGLGKGAKGKWTDAPPAGTYCYSIASRDKVGLVGAFGPDVGPITVGNPPPGLSITTSTLPAVSVGLNFNVALTTSGGTAPYAYSIVSGALPPGLVLSGGMISGSPTQAGTYSFTIKIADSAGQSATQAFSLVVGGAASTLKIKTNSVLPVATAGLTYAHIFEAEGGVAPFAWEIASGVLPGSWTLSPSTGLLSGGGVMGTMLLSIKVIDSSVPPQTVQKDFTLLIEATPSDLAIVSPYPVEDGAIELPATMAANAYSTTFVAAGATGWSVSSGKLPSGMDLDSMTGQLLGTAGSAGDYLFVVRATDGVGAAAYRAVHLEVAQVQSVTLVPVSMTPHAGKVGEAYTFTLTAQGGTVPYVWSIHEGALPPGLSLNGATGEISGTPLEAGSWSATIQVADASTAAQSTTFDVSLAVTAGPQVQGSTETAGGGGGGGCGCVGLEALLMLAILGMRKRFSQGGFCRARR